MRCECFALVVIDTVREGLEFVLQIQLQVTGPSAGKPASHPNRKSMITATSATRLAPSRPWPFWETHQYADTPISPPADVTINIELDCVRPVHSDAALTLKFDPTPHNRHGGKIMPCEVYGLVLDTPGRVRQQGCPSSPGLRSSEGS